MRPVAWIIMASGQREVDEAAFNLLPMRSGSVVRGLL